MKYVLRSWNNVVLGLNYQKNVGYTLEKGFLSTPGPVQSNQSVCFCIWSSRKTFFATMRKFGYGGRGSINGVSGGKSVNCAFTIDLW